MAAPVPPTHDQAKVTQRPSAVPWPPILLVGAVGLGWALGEAIPVELFRGAPVARIAGVVLAAAALLLDAAAVLTLRRHATTILPHRGAAALATSGPFAYSRNPIYAGNLLLTIGLAFAFANAWLLATAAVEGACPPARDHARGAASRGPLRGGLARLSRPHAPLARPASLASMSARLDRRQIAARRTRSSSSAAASLRSL